MKLEKLFYNFAGFSSSLQRFRWAHPASGSPTSPWGSHHAHRAVGRDEVRIIWIHDFSVLDQTMFRTEDGFLTLGDCRVQ